MHALAIDKIEKHETIHISWATQPTSHRSIPACSHLNANTQLDLEWSYWGYPVVSPGHMTEDLKMPTLVAPAYQDSQFHLGIMVIPTASGAANLATYIYACPQGAAHYLFTQVRNTTAQDLIGPKPYVE